MRRPYEETTTYREIVFDRHVGKMGQRMRGRPGHGITGTDAAEYVESIAKALGMDLKKRHDLDRARDILSRGMPLSKIVREIRDSQGS